MRGHWSQPSRSRRQHLLPLSGLSWLYPTYGTLLAAEGTPVADLQALMGHASLATTQGYLDSVARDRQAAAAAKPALRHMRAAAPKTPKS